MQPRLIEPTFLIEVALCRRVRQRQLLCLVVSHPADACCFGDALQSRPSVASVKHSPAPVKKESAAALDQIINQGLQGQGWPRVEA